MYKVKISHLPKLMLAYNSKKDRLSKTLFDVLQNNKNGGDSTHADCTIKKHKLLFCVNHMIMGGAEKVLCEYIKVLNTNYRITVVSKKKITEQYFLDFFKQKNIKLIDNFDFVGKKNLIKKVRYKIWLNKLFSKQDLIMDFVNCSWYKELRHVSKPKIAWCHGSTLFFEFGIGIEKLSCYDKLICLTKSFQQEFLTKYPECADKTVVFYNPINFDDVLTSAKQNINVKKPYFVVVNRLDSVDKNTETVVHAFNLFSKQNTKYHLYIIGDGPQRKYLEQIAACNKNIIFMGQQNNPYPFIKNADALILASVPTIGEGMGMVLVEAQILKTLVISSNVKNGPAEILMNGEAGILFEPKNTVDLADIMSDICNKKINKDKLVKKAIDNLYRFMPNDAINAFCRNIIQTNT